jgi:ATP-dependent DNA helicase PIF1
MNRPSKTYQSKSFLIDAIFVYKKNVFITASGGAGKSHFLRELKTIADEYGYKEEECVLTSTTGVSAYQLSGRTIHSWSGLLLPSNLTKMDADTLRNSIQTVIKKISGSKKASAIKKAKLLLIDEVSMLGGYYLEILDQVLRVVRRSEDVMGGLQLVMTGDMMQLPPCADVFVFESEVWSDLKLVTVFLETSYRFTDPNWSDLLTRCRIGELTKRDRELLSSRVISREEFEKREDAEWKGGIRPTMLLPTNKLVEEMNQEELERHPGEMFYFDSLDEVSTVVIEEKRVHKKQVSSTVPERKQIDAALEEHAEEVLMSSPVPVLMTPKIQDQMDAIFPVEHYFRLKIGCPVMLRRNLNVDMGLVNGSRGRVIQIHRQAKAVLVQFEDYDSSSCPENSSIPWHLYNITEEQTELLQDLSSRSFDCEWIFPIPFAHRELEHTEVVTSGLLSREATTMTMKRLYTDYNRIQLPLTLCAAASIHKCQGMTLKSVIIDVGKSIFADGQSYVALSRCKSLDGVYLLNLDLKKIRASKRSKSYEEELKKNAYFIK